MSLDVYLISDTTIKKKSGTGIFIRENGKTKELTYKEAIERYPDHSTYEYGEEYETNEVWCGNITHNLNEMAEQAELYYALWRPYRLHPDFPNFYDDKEEYEFEKNHHMKAKDILPFLKKGLKKLQANPEKYKKYNPKNGWGSYDGLVNFVEEYLKFCKEYPESVIEISR